MMKSTYNLCVVMSVYNGEKFLRPAIESVLNQTFDKYEFIIVDDASSDQTPEILKSYTDRRIRIITNEVNLGLAASLNHAIRVTTAVYIARQDANDISVPERFARQLECLEIRPNIGVVGSAAEWIDDNGQTIRVWPPGGENYDVSRLKIAGSS